MLPDIHLDEEDFEEIVAEGKNRITHIFPQWSDFNAHDPGITLLELFAALKESQQFFADRIGEENQKTYLKLLGIQRRKKRAAHSFVRMEAEDNYRLFRGSKMDAGTLCFETLLEKQLIQGDIQTCLAVADGSVQAHIDKEQLLSGNLLRVPAFGERPVRGSMFCLCFHQPLPERVPLDLYIEVHTGQTAPRNPIRDFPFLPLVQLEWQYYAGGKWKEIEGVQDETEGFLFTGFVRFRIPENMEKNIFMGQSGFFIRVLFREGEYDVSPIFIGISMNVCEVVQRETLVECVRGSGAGGRIRLDGELAVSGNSEVYILKENIWYPVSEYDKEISIQEGAVYLTVPGIGDVCGDEVMVINRDDTGVFRKHIGRGNGFPNQEMDVSDLQAVYESFEILVQDAVTDGYRLWQKVEDFSASSPRDRHYIFDSRQGRLYFGDLLHGMAPEGDVILAGYARTMGSDGNIKRGSVYRFRRDSLQSVAVTNISDGVCGREEETLEECFLRAGKYIEETACAVTKQDYEKFAKQTPGLLIESCQVLPVEKLRPFMKVVNENAIYLVVKPYGEEPGRIAKQCYARNIERYLERYRMIGNQVCVLFPVYVEIDVYVDAVVNTQYIHVEEQLKYAVKKFFEEYRETFGCVISQSRLYGCLEKQDFVWKVRSLHIDAGGNGAKSGEAGDIELSPYATPVLKEIKTFLTLSLASPI